MRVQSQQVNSLLVLSIWWQFELKARYFARVFPCVRSSWLPQNGATFLFVAMVTSRISRVPTILTASNSEKIEALCVWITENSDVNLGWDQLSKQSGFSHKELIVLFQLTKQQTPMAYIRQVRVHKKNSAPTHPQSSLFLQQPIATKEEDWFLFCLNGRNWFDGFDSGSLGLSWHTQLLQGLLCALNLLSFTFSF